MKIQHIPISKIQTAPYNPRVELKPGDPEYEKLKRSIKEFDCVELPVVNERTGNLVGGHQRVKVLKDLGFKKIDVVIVDLPLEREKALNLGLNKISGEWDTRKLAVLLDELTKIPDFDTEITGFDTPEIEDLVASLLEAPDQSKEEDFDAEAALRTSQPAITKPGEFIELPPHGLLCGDSSKIAPVRSFLQDMRVDLVFIDPPYNVDYYGGSRPQPKKARPKLSRQWDRIYCDNLTPQQYTRWFRRVLKNIRQHVTPGAPFYIWNGHSQFGPMHQMLGDLGFHISCVITWAKESFAISYGDYNQQTEFCLYGWLADNGAHRWYGPTNESTLWQVKRDPTRTYQHPTQKPLELAERAIRNSSRPGGLVLDTFLGSGTTLIAAQRTGRRCYGIEIDPHYCDVIVRRYMAFIGEDQMPPEVAARYRLTD